jgi:heptaprenyl diphosphate synthase
MKCLTGKTDYDRSGSKYRLKLLSFFAALCLFLSAVEYAIPKPLPFLRLGLANLPVLLSLSKLRRKDVLLLVFLKVLGQGFISGTFFSYVFVFSAAGSFSSGIVMLGLYTLLNKKKFLSYIGFSLAGALANTAAQLTVARFILFGNNTKYIAPVLLAAGTITGFILGVFANMFAEKSFWYASLAKEEHS